MAYAIFTLSDKTRLISRSPGKLDEVLSYAGGLLGILISFMGFFMMSFN